MSTNALDEILEGFVVCEPGSFRVRFANQAAKKWFPEISSSAELGPRLGSLSAELVSDRLKKRNRFEWDTPSFELRKGYPTRLRATIRKGHWEDSEAWIIHLQDDQRVIEKELLLNGFTGILEQEKAQVLRVNHSIRNLLDSLDQGYFLFDHSGTCQSIYSAACANIFGESPEGKFFWDYLRLSDEKSTDRIRQWVELLFTEGTDFDDLVPLGPKEIHPTPEKTISLNYRMTYHPESGAPEYIVVIATDETETREAQIRAEHEAAYSQAIIRIFKSRSRFFEFIRDSKTFFTRLDEELALLQTDWSRIARLVHTFKGASSYFSLLDMTRLAHDVETELQAQRHQPSPSPKLRELCGKLKESFESFLNDHKDLLETEPDKSQRSVDISLDLLQAFEWVLTHTPEEELSRRDIPLEFKRTFMHEPISSSLQFFDHVIAVEASRQEKEVERLQLRGGALKVNLEAYRDLMSSLIHIFRNTIAHGIETPRERREAGKPPQGKVWVEVTRPTETTLLLAIHDDGKGVDAQAVRAAAAARGAEVPPEETNEQTLQRIFMPGLSTAEEVTELAGRGVGLEAVQAEAQKLGGRAWVESRLGQGASFFIEVPWMD